MKSAICNRRGVALALAVYALVVVMALAGAVFMVATTEQRVAETTRGVYGTLALAEAGAYETIGASNAQSLNDLQIYPSDSIVLGTRSFHGTIRRLSANLFLIDVYGTAGGGLGGVASRVGVLARRSAAWQECDTAHDGAVAVARDTLLVDQFLAMSAKCFTDNALQATSSLVPLRSRGWSQLF